MDDGGLVVISSPANPFRCPPGPYERASLIAYWLKIWKPKSKLLILDSKDAFSKQRLFQNAWAQLYPGLIEWVSLSQGGKVTAVDPASLTVVTDFARHKAAVANIIPRNIIERFTASWNGAEIFRMDFSPAISANPFVSFFAVATEGGKITFRWTGDEGFAVEESVAIDVA